MPKPKALKDVANEGFERIVRAVNKAKAKALKIANRAATETVNILTDDNDKTRSENAKIKNRNL